MSQKIYVSNIAFSATDEDLKGFFMLYGNVTSAIIIKDRETGRSRGFGFVELDDATKALAESDGSSFQGRPITVSVAKERERNSYRK